MFRTVTLSINRSLTMYTGQ